MEYDRRKFISFLGKAGIGTMVTPPFLSGCGSTSTPLTVENGSKERLMELQKTALVGLEPSDRDDLLLTNGLDYHTLLKWGDTISEKDTFGFNNDFVCFIPLDEQDPKDGLLWVNHEYIHPLFVSGFDYKRHKRSPKHRTREQVDKEMYNVGGSIVRIREENGKWGIVENDPLNRRITAQTPIQLNWDTPIKGKTVVMGTHSNCSGGITPWKTFLTCEENYDSFFGETTYDKNNEHLYKFVSSKPESLREGTLYVADTMNGKWLALDWEKQAVLKTKFKNQTEVLIRAREAAKLLGATELNRPEDIEIDPITGNIFVSLTNNKDKGDYHGSILKIEEANGAFDALGFKASTYKAGGGENGFSCPDNLAFDQSGNLWMTSDMSGSAMNKKGSPYLPFKNNGLFVIPRYGKEAGKVIQMASAPKDAELTGPWFSPDGKTLFLSVQHPGEQTTDINNPTSRWPFDADNIPKPAVVAITGDLIEKMNKLNQMEH